MKRQIKIAIFIFFLSAGFFAAGKSGIIKNKIPVFSEYNKLYREKINLQEEIKKLKKEQKDLNENLKKYTYDSGIFPDAQSQLDFYSMYTGESAVKGEGLVITIDDIGSLDPENAYVMTGILHDEDMALVLNEVRNAGAEAIAVNSHRITPSSGVICAWAFIRFDDIKSLEYAPFKIYAVGNGEKMKEKLLSENSYLNKLKIRKISFDIEVLPEVEISKSKSAGNIQYLEPAK